MSFKSNPYNTGGVNAPRNYEEQAGDGLKMTAACDGTTDGQPNVNPVNPGSHHPSGAGVAQANKP